MKEENDDFIRHIIRNNRQHLILPERKEEKFEYGYDEPEDDGRQDDERDPPPTTTEIVTWHRLKRLPIDVFDGSRSNLLLAYVDSDVHFSEAVVKEIGVRMDRLVTRRQMAYVVGLLKDKSRISGLIRKYERCNY